jgi:hypothetical protein
VKFLHEEIPQRTLILAVLGDEPLQPGEAEHLALGVVGLYQPVAVEQDAVAEDEDAARGEEVVELAVLEKDCERLEQLGLTLAESKEVLGRLQQHVLAMAFEHAARTTLPGHATSPT